MYEYIKSLANKCVYTIEKLFTFLLVTSKNVSLMLYFWDQTLLEMKDIGILIYHWNIDISFLVFFFLDAYSVKLKRKKYII